jgi:hypothetical protein
MERAFEVVTAGGSSDDRKQILLRDIRKCLVLTQEGQAHGKQPFHAERFAKAEGGGRDAHRRCRQVAIDAIAARPRFKRRSTFDPSQSARKPCFEINIIR